MDTILNNNNNHNIGLKKPKVNKTRHKIKVCGKCNKQQTSNWDRHWKTKHPGEDPFEET